MKDKETVDIRLTSSVPCPSLSHGLPSLDVSTCMVESALTGHVNSPRNRRFSFTMKQRAGTEIKISFNCLANSLYSQEYIFRKWKKKSFAENK